MGSGLLWPLALSIALAAAVVAIHEAAWRLIPTYPAPVAEVATWRPLGPSHPRSIRGYPCQPSISNTASPRRRPSPRACTRRRPSPRKSSPSPVWLPSPPLRPGA
ncbi:hypothetical protein CHELA40_14277 [Chelatococcus asaccharovorans]|nr:hypothetical protein CHELA17_61343 [Chelatococcus asaccharovorans]CAH1676409.1 hypothetical protein CHELA40_14277 [Chelatococcus asaccharovorans]